MSNEEIVALANDIKKNYKTNDPFKIAKSLGIKFHYEPYKKNIMQGRVLQPFKNLPPCICLNSNFDVKSQVIFCAHELGHAIMHRNVCDYFDNDPISNPYEYEANLFAVALLFDSSLFKYDIKKMDNFILKFILDYNVKY